MRIIIVAPGFSENSGGVNALHLLCHRLNVMGQAAYLWHYKRPCLNFPVGSKRWLQSLLGLMFYKLKRKTIRRKSFLLNQAWQTSELKSWDEGVDDWVVYPDNVYSNTLNASNIVRWMLIGTPLSAYEDGKVANKLTYFYNKAYALGVSDPKILRAQNFRHDLFFDDKDTQKQGCCHMYRKNNSKSPPIHPKNSICLDGMGLADIAYWMRRSETFVSYDLYTQHSIHAVVCGCKSIVAPSSELREDDWLPEEDRFGIAYGYHRLEWAESTKPRLLARLKANEAEELEQTKSLIQAMKMASHNSRVNDLSF
jgi:hypothetical protein